MSERRERKNFTEEFKEKIRGKINIWKKKSFKFLKKAEIIMVLEKLK